MDRYMADILEAWRKARGLSRIQLAMRLGIARSRLTELYLCRPPVPGQEDYRERVEVLAARFGADPDRLDEVLRGQANSH